MAPPYRLVGGRPTQRPREIMNSRRTCILASLNTDLRRWGSRCARRSNRRGGSEWRDRSKNAQLPRSVLGGITGGLRELFRSPFLGGVGQDGPAGPAYSTILTPPRSQSMRFLGAAARARAFRRHGAPARRIRSTHAATPPGFRGHGRAAAGLNSTVGFTSDARPWFDFFGVMLGVGFFPT